MISTPERETAVRGRMPVAARDRRPALAALALLLILLGALGSALLVFRSGDRINVLAARDNIAFGQKVSRSDFTEVRTAADTPGVIKAADISSFVGTHSLSYVPAGALLSPKMLSVAPPLPPGSEGVGLVLDASRRPSEFPQPGQVVRVYYVQGGSGGTGPGNPVLVNAARVLGVGKGSSAGTRSLTLLVASNLAQNLTDYASSNNVAISLLPDETKPQIDVTTPQAAQ